MKKIVICFFAILSLFSCKSEDRCLNLEKENLNIEGLISDLQEHRSYVTLIPYNKANRVSVFADSVEYIIVCKNGKKSFLNINPNKNEVLRKINKTFDLFKKYNLLSLEIYDNYTVVNTNYSDSTYEDLHDLDSSYIDNTKELYSKNCLDTNEKCPYKYGFVILHSSDIKSIDHLAISNLKKYSRNVYYFRSYMNANTKRCIACECNW